MKLLVFSDSHNDPRRMLEVMENEKEDTDGCFHLGDGIYDADKLQELYPQIPLYVVQGNCDPGSFEPYEGLAPFGGILFFYTHGHTLQVKEGVDVLWWKASRRGADAVLFGHTHVPYYENRNGIHLFNPGSISRPRFGPPSYGRVLVENGTPHFEICKYSG